MCTYLFAIDKDPRFPLVVVGNRDEFLKRPTTGLHKWVPNKDFWPNGKPIFGGKDNEAGGTWLGANQEGRWAFVTNVRRPPFDTSFESSRGDLPLRWLSGSLTLEKFVDWLEEKKSSYAPFNLIFGAGKAAHFVSSDLPTQIKLPSGVYGISNGSLDTPWPKVAQGKKRLKTLLNTQWEEEDLLDICIDKTRFEQNLPQTGVSHQLEFDLSAMYVEMEGYGSRLTTLITLDQSQALTVKEWTHPSLDSSEFTIETSLS